MTPRRFGSADRVLAIRARRSRPAARVALLMLFAAVADTRLAGTGDRRRRGAARSPARALRHRDAAERHRPRPAPAGCSHQHHSDSRWRGGDQRRGADRPRATRAPRVGCRSRPPRHVPGCDAAAAVGRSRSAGAGGRGGTRAECPSPEHAWAPAHRRNCEGWRQRPRRARRAGRTRRRRRDGLGGDRRRGRARSHRGHGVVDAGSGSDRAPRRQRHRRHAEPVTHRANRWVR